jgi:hypothetical protein
MYEQSTSLPGLTVTGTPKDKSLILPGLLHATTTTTIIIIIIIIMKFFIIG